MEYNFDYLVNEFVSYLQNNQYNQTDIAIHCDNEEKAFVLLNVFLKLGKAWSATAPIFSTDENRIITRWRKEGPNTCYRLNEKDPQFVARSNIRFYQNRDNVEVVEFTDVFLSLKEYFPEVPADEDIKDDKKGKFSLFSSKKKKADTVVPVEKEISQNETVTVPVQSATELPQTPDYHASNNGQQNTGVVFYNTNEQPTEHEQVNGEKAVNEPEIQENEMDEVRPNTLTAPAETSSESVASDESDRSNNTTNNAETLIDKVITDVTENGKDATDEELLSLVAKKKYFNALPRINIPFTVKDNAFMTPEAAIYRIFKFNELGIRYEYKATDFWVQCDKEWELIFILLHPEKINYIE